MANLIVTPGIVEDFSWINVQNYIKVNDLRGTVLDDKTNNGFR